MFRSESRDFSPHQGAMKRSTTILRTCVWATASLCCIALPVAAQTTQVNLKAQAKGVDFTGAASTKPFKTGTALPTTCAIGDSYFKSDATAGQNLFGCTAVNTWTLESGGGLPSFSGNADHLLGTNGSTASWIALAGDVSGAPGSLQVKGLRGNPVSSATPTDGQLLRFNSTTMNWEPATVASSSSGTNSSVSTTTGGDIYGPISSVTVTRLQNKPVAAISPADGQVLTWSQAAGQWQPLSPTGTGSGTTTQSASLSVLGVTYTSANTLSIGSGCSIANPCNVRFGNNVISITTSSTVTWQSGAGTAFIYVTTNGTVTVGSSLSLTCSSSCIAASSVSSFPVNTIPIFTWNAVLNGWDPAGGQDARAYLSNKLISAGTGVIIVESGQQSTIGVDTTLIPTYTNGTASLTFGSLAANSCAADLTVSVPGAILGDSVAPGWPASLPGSVFGNMRVTAANLVSVRLCNLGSAAATVAANTYRATIVRGL